MNRHPGLDDLLRELAARERHNRRDALVRLAARLRARDACEYCLLPTIGEFHVDHVVPSALWNAYVEGQIRALPPSPAARGPDHLDNFAWSCASCNVAKGRQVTRRARSVVSRLFNPRLDRWDEHFVFFHSYLIIRGISLVGQATELALQFNEPRLGGPLAVRHDLVVMGRYPPAWALGWAVT